MDSVYIFLLVNAREIHGNILNLEINPIIATICSPSYLHPKPQHPSHDPLPPSSLVPFFPLSIIPPSFPPTLHLPNLLPTHSPNLPAGNCHLSFFNLLSESYTFPRSLVTFIPRSLIPLFRTSFVPTSFHSPTFPRPRSHPWTLSPSLGPPKHAHRPSLSPTHLLFLQLSPTLSLHFHHFRQSTP